MNIDFRDAFGKKGDFITSPEVSQMFGECVAIWIIHEWRKMGGPLPLQVNTCKLLIGVPYLESDEGILS